MLLRVHGCGVLLTGGAGSGKSTLALELIARGHALVADDAVSLRRRGHALEAQAEPLLRGLLAVRGLGVLDVRAMYGARAVRLRQRLDLVVRLDGRAPARIDVLLGGARSRRTVLGRRLPVISLGAALRHNLPTLVEAACLAQRLRDRGRFPARSLAARQRRAIKNNA